VLGCDAGAAITHGNDRVRSLASGPRAHGGR
jgi:hypothetical protein